MVGFDLGAARNMAPPQLAAPLQAPFAAQARQEQNKQQQQSNEYNEYGDYDDEYAEDGDNYGYDNAGGNNSGGADDIPEEVAAYFSKFYAAMVNNRIGDVRYFYYKEWTQLTKIYFADVEWPSAAAVAHLCEENEVFLLCYKELYFRHINVHGAPQIQHRMQSWTNYVALFDTFLDGAVTSNLRLPLEWLNDMIDEFLYHFQDFCTIRNNPLDQTEEVQEFLTANPNVWKVQTVLGYLTSFAERSGIKSILTDDKAKVTGVAATRLPVLQGLGYFSLVGLCRLHCMLADYRFAVKVLDPIDIDDKRGLFTRVTASHISLFYHLGFSYFMMRRYADAIDVWSMILIAHRTSKERTSSFADDQIMSKYDKMLGLTAIASSLCPGQNLDETVRVLLADKFGERLQRLAGHDESTFEDIFMRACPKLIEPAPVPVPASGVVAAPNALQLKWLIDEVRQQSALPMVRSYLKLYKSIHIDKLASFCGQAKVSDFRESLMSIKYQSRQRLHQPDTSPLEGERTSVNDVHFYVVGDMVFIDEARRSSPYAKYFVANALKFNQAVGDLHEAGVLSRHNRKNHHKNKDNNERR